MAMPTEALRNALLADDVDAIEQSLVEGTDPDLVLDDRGATLLS
jgi:hypothetical protein